MIFELSPSTVLPLFWQNFLRRRQIFEKKTVKKGVFRHFLENFDQKIAFFRRALPLKISKVFSGRSAKSGFLKKTQRGDPLGWQGVESLRGGGGASAPKSAPDFQYPSCDHAFKLHFKAMRNFVWLKWPTGTLIPQWHINLVCRTLCLQLGS